VPFPTVVLLHGQPDSSASFWALRQELRRQLDPEIRIAVPDRPGYGVNRLPATDYPGNVAWLRSWLARFDAGPVLLVGHSWAGGVAALAASESGAASAGRESDGVAAPQWAGLVLLASVGPGCLVPVDTLLAAPVLGDLLSFLTFRLGRGALARRTASVLTRITPVEETPYAWASGAAMTVRPFWRSFLVEQRALVAQLPLISQALSGIAVPTRVLVGTHDAVIPAATGAALAEQIADSTLHPIEGGPDLQVRRPEAVAEQIAALAETAFR
jgi:pimeloyl-ACP methyl ester carboxylesterase